MVYEVFLILPIPMSIAVACYKFGRIRSRTGLLWGRFMQEASREGDEGLLW